MFNTYIKLLLRILPFYVILKVFLEQKLGIIGFGYIKELIIIFSGIVLVFNMIKQKIKPQLDLLDYLIVAYFLYGIIITFFNGLGIHSIIFGLKYDFEMLAIFSIVRHGRVFLGEKLGDYIKLFLVYSGIAIFIGMIFAFVVGEDFLLLFGFKQYYAGWTFGGGIPIYHGVEASGIRRFQGIFDGPNQAAFFIITYITWWLFYNRKNIDFFVLLILSILLFVLFFTFSRSAMLGAFIGTFITLILNIKKIWKKYKAIMITFLAIGIIFGGVFTFLFQDKIYNVIIRKASTGAHFERMNIGYQKFTNKPLGHGLGESGPAYRGVYPEKANIKYEPEYIPESWFVQQLVEGGIIYFTIFLFINILLLIKTYKFSPILFGGTLAVFIMNIFLHTFEASYVSILFFLLLGLVVHNKKYKKIV